MQLNLLSTFSGEVHISNIELINKSISNSVKLILTCRTHFFKTQVAIRTMFGEPEEQNSKALVLPGNGAVSQQGYFKVIYIAPLNRNQIEEFLKKYAGENSKEVLQFIEKRPRLMDLAKRPILLALIVRAIPYLHERKTVENITMADLYQILTDLWIWHSNSLKLVEEEIDMDLRKQRIGPKKVDFLEKLTMEMLLEGGKNSIHHIQLSEAVDHYIKVDDILTEADQDYFEKEIRCCSFLTSDSSDHYIFAHNSFQEFFLARMLVNELKEDSPTLFKQYIYLPVEAYGFISEMIPDLSDFQNTLCKWLKNNYFPVAALIGQLGYYEMLPDLCEVLSNGNYEVETIYNSARAIERLHNSSFQPYSQMIFKWKGSDTLVDCYRLDTIAIRGNKRTKPEPGLNPPSFVLKEYVDHPEHEWKNVSDLLLATLNHDHQFVRINASHALVRWLHPSHIPNVLRILENERQPSVKDNLCFAFFKLWQEGKLKDYHNSLETFGFIQSDYEKYKFK